MQYVMYNTRVGDDVRRGASRLVVACVQKHTVGTDSQGHGREHCLEDSMHSICTANTHTQQHSVVGQVANTEDTSRAFNAVQPATHLCRHPHP